MRLTHHFLRPETWRNPGLSLGFVLAASSLLILRAVSDLVGSGGGEAYGDYEGFKKSAREIMRRLVDALPLWLERAKT